MTFCKREDSPENPDERLARLIEARTRILQGSWMWNIPKSRHVATRQIADEELRDLEGVEAVARTARLTALVRCLLENA